MRRESYGFTILETIFSSLFIGLTVLAIVNLFPGAYLSIRQSECKIQADAISSSILDDLRSRNFKDVIAEVDASGLYKGSNPLYQLTTIEGIEYKPEVSFKPVGASLGTSAFPTGSAEPDKIRLITVKVSYRLGTTLKETVHQTVLHQMSTPEGRLSYSQGSNP